MVAILDTEQAFINVCWLEPETGDVEPIGLGRLMERSKAIAMLALNMSAMVAAATDLDGSQFTVVAHHSAEEGAALCLVPCEDMDSDEGVDIAEKLREFFAEFMVYAGDAPGLKSADVEFCQVSFSHVRGLMQAMRHYTENAPDLVTPDDVDMDGLNEGERQQVEAEGAEHLRDAWIFCQLPETPASGLKELHAMACAADLANVPFAYSVIEEAVKDGERGLDIKDARCFKKHNAFGLRLN